MCDAFIHLFLFLNRLFTFFTIVLIVTPEFVVVGCLCVAVATAAETDVELSSLLLPILMSGSSGIFFVFLWVEMVVCDVVVVTVGTVATIPSDLNLVCGWQLANDFDFVC